MFVRTENGIYETIKCLGDGSCYCNNGNKNKYISSFEILKQSDIIEELCDELVVAYKDCCEKRTYLYNGTIQEFKENRPNYKNKFFTYYGAIWTDKGLIYVAKMNNEGDFELI